MSTGGKPGSIATSLSSSKTTVSAKSGTASTATVTRTLIDTPSLILLNHLALSTEKTQKQIASQIRISVEQKNTSLLRYNATYRPHCTSKSPK